MGKRARYSWLRNLVLAILSNNDSAHGYVIYKRIEDAVGARWRPSIGTLYRVLARLRDEGLIECFKQNRRTVCKITDKGINHVVNEVLTHLPKFLGVMNEILNSYLSIVKSKNMKVDPDIHEKIQKLLHTIKQYNFTSTTDQNTRSSR